MGDPDTRREQDAEPAEQSGGGSAGSQPPRALGRGLEDLSRLFLPRRQDNAPAGEPAAAAKPDAGRVSARDRGGLMLLRPADRLTRSQVIAIIEEPWGAIEEHLLAIDTSVPCSPCGIIDVLAVDAARRLVVIDIDPFAGDTLLLRGLGHMEWLVRNAANVRRMYPGREIDFAAPPRLVLVAPRFSAAARHAVAQIGDPEVACVRYRGLDVSGWTGVFFEPVADDDR